MKTHKSLYFIMFTVLFVMVVLNAVIFHSSKCSGEYLQTDDVWKHSSIIKLSDYHSQQNLLRYFMQNPDTALETSDQIQDYLITYQYSTSPRSSQEIIELTKQLNLAEKDILNVTHVSTLLQNTLHYKETIHQRIANAQDIITVLYPLSGDPWLLKNASRCQKDYFGLEYLNPMPVLENSLTLFINYRITDLLSFFCFGMLAALSGYYIKKRISSPEEIPGIISVTGVLSFLCFLCMYGSNLLIVYLLYGLPDFSLPIQSLESYYTCQYPLSIGLFITLWFTIKVMTHIVLLLICILSVSGKHPVASNIIFAIFLGFELDCFQKADDALSLLVFREVNLFSGFTPERFFNRYLNVNFQGNLILRFPVFLTILSFTLLLFFIMFFRRIHLLRDKARQELAREYFSEIDKRYQETRRLWHDFNNHMLTIKELYHSGNIPEAERYIDDLSTQTRQRLTPVKTGSNAVDLLLYRKHSQALEQGIHIRYIVGCSLKKHGIMDYDLCSLLGNLLDNALEACSKLEQDTCTISLRLEDMGSMLFISCENPYAGTLQEDNGQLITTKKEKSHHGLGLLSVRQICKKYKGTMEISSSGIDSSSSQFLIKILLNDAK